MKGGEDVAVNKELREYLKECEQKEWTEADKRITAKYAENKQQAINNPEVKKMYALLDTAKNALTELDKFNINLSYLNARNIIDDKFNLANHIAQEYINDGIEELRQQRDSIRDKYQMLLLRLSLEKNFDTINQILSEAGIGFTK